MGGIRQLHLITILSSFRERLSANPPASLSAGRKKCNDDFTVERAVANLDRLP
jgi:hypothetical protein